ncbi:MAG: glycosyltransferase [Candidatus Pacebacteria bacterium]|jgi:glycosyltransferase involved in cell wall biosynthesis|nr:glycosyltransferase [Candidatus Paceibacterota bacterium]MBT6756052.1 glycosyltransferase [Candidatus Paceibacterota bacterium]
MVKKAKPFFSIITCTRNSEKFISQNLSSMKNQTFNDFEHVFVDGESTDDTVKLLKEYKKDNPKLNIRILSKKPQGISNAMNEGIKKSRGKYIFILHSDDSFYNNSILENSAKYLLKNLDLDWIYGKIRVIDEKSNEVGHFPTKRIFQKSWKYLLKFINYIPHQAVFTKKEVFDEHGLFEEKYKSAMDQELWLRINYKTKWSFIDATIANYRIHKNAQSSGKANYKKNLEEYYGIQRKYLVLWEKPISLLINYVVEKMNKTVR